MGRLELSWWCRRTRPRRQSGRLDANCAYSDEQRYAEKLVDCLNRSPRHHLGVVAYDDREIELDGRKVVGPTGGTYRRTQAMVTRLEDSLPLGAEEYPDRTHWRTLNRQVDVQLLKNPGYRILHTVLVERNGFIHALAFGTPLAEQAGALFAPPVYDAWIQVGSTLPG